MPNLASLWPNLLYFCIVPCGAVIAGSILLFLILKYYNIELPGGFKFTRRDPPAKDKLATSEKPASAQPPPAPPPAQSIGVQFTDSASMNVNITQGDSISAGGHAIKAEEGAVVIVEAESPQPPTGAAAPTPRVERFIDRGPIMSSVREALRNRAATAVVGVGGMGGVGKTELALFLSKEFNDALWMEVNSRSLEQVQFSLAFALGITLPPNTDADGRAELLRAAFAQQPRTVIFDDVRQGFDLPKCLPPSPPCAVLITSRLRQLPGVRSQDIHSLNVMDEKQAKELLSDEGMKGALEQEPTAGDDLAKLCGYHPLALRLAAARWAQRPAPLSQFNAALTHRLTQLSGPDPKDPTANLRANFDLSYEALTADDRRRFRALAVFAETGFAPAAARAVWNDPHPDADAALTRLLTVSLLQNQSRGEATTARGLSPLPTAERFALHDLLREYALEKLREAKEDEAAYRAHAGLLIEAFGREWNPEKNPQLTIELDNVAEVAEWALMAKDSFVLGSMATTPRNWLMLFDMRDQQMKWASQSLALGIEDKELRANVLSSIGDVHTRLSELPEARARYEEALPIYRAIGAKLGEANCIQRLGDVHTALSELPEARARYEEALPIYRAIGAKLGEANVLSSQGRLLVMSGEGQKGLQTLQDALDLYAAIGDKVGQANIYTARGH
ncbi:MAG: tetratricopeptide repeat protein [Chloroflexi bacterium]|nr:tetratricopeptide repeat protein [Chloroflexota bacterium]